MKDINLVPAWHGCEELKTYYLIGESNHLTPDQLEARGIGVNDDGYFGRGIYLSQYPSYGFEYANKLNHLLCSWVLMGKVYPVTESIKTKDSLNGKRMKDGYDSYYVLVNREGIPLHSPPLAVH